MVRSFLRLAAIPALALSLAAWGCDQAGQVLGPGSLTEAKGGESSGKGSADARRGRVVKDADTTRGSRSAVIGQDGGRITLGQVTLVVPAGAVSEPALFTVTRSSDDLQASFTASRQSLNDVGAAGFRVPVEITFKYDMATFTGDETGLVIGWLVPGGEVRLQTTEVNATAKSVTAKVRHFSDYGVFPPGFRELLWL